MAFACIFTDAHATNPEVHTSNHNSVSLGWDAGPLGAGVQAREGRREILPWVTF